MVKSMAPDRHNGAVKPTQADTDAREAHDDADELLDEALQETFPASDPVATSSGLIPGRPRRAKTRALGRRPPA